MEYRIGTNLQRLECSGCEGIFATGETVIEDDDKLYCEICYKEKQEIE